jgi:MraZ protein
MFLGRYEHSMDEKGRLTIPVRFREPLSAGAYLTLGFDKNLMVLTPDVFQSISQRVKQTSLTDNEARLLKRLLYSNAEFVEIDRNGRILIPHWLRQGVGIETNVIIAGAGDFFEIWSPELWSQQDAKLQDSDANARRFGDFDIPV